jgi:hypothetical protein
MRNYIAITHSWHVFTKGFITTPFEAEDDEQAEIEGICINYKHNLPLSSSDTHVIPMENYDYPLRTKLTWKERFSGVYTP